MIVEQRKTVKITAEPLSNDDSSQKLGDFFRSELKRRQQVDKV